MPIQPSYQLVGSSKYIGQAFQASLKLRRANLRCFDLNVSRRTLGRVHMQPLTGPVKVGAIDAEALIGPFLKQARVRTDTNCLEA